MQPKISELLAALPAEAAEAGTTEPLAEQAALKELLSQVGQRPVPVGSLRRLWSLGGLHAQITVAYLAYWLRSWFGDADAKQRKLLETHLRAAVKLLSTLGYLRGAAMKIGQTLANYPDVVPEQFVTTLEKLHFEAPPMHFSLLREMVRNELGSDPEEVFASFETEAFAAASLGQVHRARLKSGEPVAVKIQYPGIGRTIRSDFRTLFPLLLPMRLTRDWESARAQLEEVRRHLEYETDYRREAESMRKARGLFTEDDGIVVPRVHERYSTQRVLTMDFVQGTHIDRWLARQPSQTARDEFGVKLIVAWYRLLFAGRMNYIDWHPGNFLFHDDGRLGLIDFGCMQHYDEEQWDWVRQADEVMQSGDDAELTAFVKGYCKIGDAEEESDRLSLAEQFCRWTWGPRLQAGPYDYGDAEQFRHGFTLLAEQARKRYTRGQRWVTYLVRQDLGCRAMLYRLRAKIDLHVLRDREVGAAGWN